MIQNPPDLTLKGFRQKEVQLFAVQTKPDVILLEAEGYGNRTGEGAPGEGYNDIVMLEYYGDKLRVIVWADINQEDPTHIIEMENARESNRRTND